MRRFVGSVGITSLHSFIESLILPKTSKWINKPELQSRSAQRRWRWKRQIRKRLGIPKHHKGRREERIKQLQWSLTWVKVVIATFRLQCYSLEWKKMEAKKGNSAPLSKIPPISLNRHHRGWGLVGGGRWRIASHYPTTLVFCLLDPTRTKREEKN